MTGLETAVQEITLVLFTTLAPSGAFAVAVMAALVFANAAEERVLRRIGNCQGIPIAASLAGLIASATHLGNPANALYVFFGAGHSPLSNEVLCAVVFLGVASICWLYSFSEHPGALRRRVGSLLTIVSGVAFVTAIAFAYRVDTIASWNMPVVPIALWANAFVGGPLLALLSLRIARFDPARGAFGRLLVVVSAAGVAASTVLYAVQGAMLPSIENSYTTAAALVPGYGGMVAAFAVLSGVACLLCALPLFARRELTVPRCVVACLLAFAGIFVVRFAFYMMHLTVGL